MDVLKKIWKIIEFFLAPFIAAIVIYVFGMFFSGELMFGVEYTLSDDGEYYILSDYGEFNFRREFDIPEEYNGKPVGEIGDGAFESCIFLGSVTIPGSITSIGHEAFRFCDGLTSVVISDGVTSIGHSAFSYCSNIESVEIPDSVTSIGFAPFYLCDRLTSINVGESNTVYKDIDGNLYTKDGKALIQYAEAKIATSFVIPDSVTSICGYAFYRCESLTSIVIPDSVTSIGSLAFRACENLTDVYYTGSEQDWEEIDIGDYNYYLTDATIHYNYVPEE